jgi:hypothetical protein
MKIMFRSLQDNDSLDNECVIPDAKHMLRILDDVRKGEPTVCELISDSGRELMLGIGPKFGFAQYKASDGEPPYFITAKDAGNASRCFYEYWAGGTLSEIPVKYCLPIDIIRELAVHFFETGQRGSSAKWVTL